MKVSVLVTTYNGERFIEEQLDSIRTQTVPVSQVVIRDDGSTDGTVEIVRTFIARHALSGWHVQVNETNLGSARNVLTHLKELDGDAVFLADQDDVWAENKVEIMTRYLDANPDLTLVVSRTSTVNEHGKPDTNGKLTRQVNSGSRIYRGSRTEPETLEFEDFLGYTTVPLHAMCIRGSTLRQISAANEFPNLNKSLGPDWYLGMWGSVLGDCLLIPDILVYRRVHDANISLGGMRKTKVLSANTDRRLLMLNEAEQAHRAILSNSKLTHNLTKQQQKVTLRTANFLAIRADFTRHASMLKAVTLLSNFDLYIKSAGTLRHATRMWVADVMYAYNINWKLKKRA